MRALRSPIPTKNNKASFRASVRNEKARAVEPFRIWGLVPIPISEKVVRKEEPREDEREEFYYD